MSPLDPTRVGVTLGFPRVSGDEPSPDWQRRTDSSFSPRERG